jgi:broad specificity phosphatase PhoE
MLVIAYQVMRHPGYLRPVLRWYSSTLCPRIARRLRRQTPYQFATRFMTTPPSTSTTPAADNATENQATPAPMPPKTRTLLLIRHGQSTYNVEGRLPSQLAGIPLTDEGRRQVHRAAVALSALPLSAIISSPLERALETAQIVARGWGLPVRTDPRLMDTNVERWAGQTIAEVAKNDPEWRRYLANLDDPPEGAESFSSVQERAVAAAKDALADPANGDYIVLVAHGDVVKLILARYMNTPIPAVPYLAIGNASISGLAFTGDETPHVLATNWTPDPRWLVAPFTPPPATPEAPNGTSSAAGAAGTITTAEASPAEGDQQPSTNPPHDA